MFVEAKATVVKFTEEDIITTSTVQTDTNGNPILPEQTEDPNDW